MKKIFSIILFSIVSSLAAFAELRPSPRYLDIGTDLDFSFSQNTVGLTEIMVKNLEVDLTEMADAMSDDGLVFAFGTNANMYVDLNLGENKGFGFYLGFDGAGRFSTGKGLFEFLGYGNSDGSIDTSMSVQSEMFIDTGAKIKMKTGKFGWTFKPSYYIPVYYMPYTTMDMEVSTSEAGYTLKAYGSTDFAVYSNFDLRNVFDEDFSYLGTSEFMSSLGDDITTILSSGGISFGAECEYQLFNTLCVAAYTDIPIIPGRLRYKTSGHATLEATLGTVLDSASSDEELEKSWSKDVSLNDTEESSYSVRKPLRFGTEAAWRPFGSWCTFRPLLGVAFRNPWGDDFSKEESIFMEYELRAEMTILYFLKCNFATLYRNEVYAQQFGFGLNFRVFEMNVDFATCGADFSKTWSLSGLEAHVGLRCGF
ncbi:hypothetical protein [Treponema sp.]|uniref:hypothetical protein n=1 Tax=Treponema sp. TaxID=166 RepID=UPI0025FAE439|nr:hypothetical protein [Treponema sp.]MCR5218968.1 hypothetical protein [Treponema sp.]